MPSRQRFDRQRAFAQTADHQIASRFDTFCYGDFAFAGQKFNGAHFAQIHAYGIVRAAGFDFVQLKSRIVVFGTGRRFFFAFFFIFDNVDSHIGNHGHNVFDLLVFRRQSVVQFVNRDITAVFAFADQLFYGRPQRIEKRIV